MELRAALSEILRKVCGLCIVGVSACRPSVEPPAPATPATQASRLAYIAVGDQASELRIADVTTGAQASAVTLPAGAESLFWDFTQSRLLLSTPDRQLWQADWGKKTVGAIGSLPKGLSGTLIAAWIEAPGGDIRALEMRELGPGEAKNRPVEPPDAQPYDAIVWQLDANKGWVVIERIATSWGVDGSPGYAVADGFRHEKGFSTLTLRRGSTCDTLPCDTPAAPDVLRSLSSLSGGTGTPEETGVLELPRDQGRIVFGVTIGDGPHITRPIWLFPNRSGNPVVLPLDSPTALRLAVQGRYVLVAGERDADDPIVIDTGSGKVVFSTTGTGAVWVPPTR